MIREYSGADRVAISEMAEDIQRFFAVTDKSGESLAFRSKTDVEKYVDKILNDAGEMNGAVFVAEESEIIGFAQCVIIDHGKTSDIIFDLTHQPRKDGWIGLLFVKDDWRSKGVGQKLMDALKRHLVSQGCDTMRLLVLSDNKNAVEFYKKCGLTIHDVEMVMPL
jgi:ribosomal protein S18 acetylase RimI-like enzyme